MDIQLFDTKENLLNNIAKFLREVIFAIDVDNTNLLSTEEAEKLLLRINNKIAEWKSEDKKAARDY